jgi:peptidoglycan biosynthesis protein MviN/MurJ (putative lipid II flippase)
MTASAVRAESERRAGASPQARAGAAMAIATLAMAGASGAQALLYLSEFGVTERTDAFFAAFALYTVFGIFTQAIRVTSVPLLVGPRRMSRRDFGLALALIALPAAIACGPLAGPLAQGLAPGVDEAARSLTQDGVRILGGAMILQLAAAGIATVLGTWDRFDHIAGGYIVGAMAGLVTYLVLVGTAEELTLAWSMLAMAVVTCGWMAVGLRRPAEPDLEEGRASARRLLAEAGGVLARTLVYFVINGLYLITLAWMSAQDAGDASVLSYAYLYVSYLVAGTSVSVGISRVPEMTRGAQSDWREVVADTVPHGFRYAMLVAAPAVAALVAAGATLIGELFPDSLPPGDVATLRGFAALLAPWLVAALLVNFLLPALFALRRAGLVNWLALPLIALHVAATFVGERLFGVEGIVGAMWVAPTAYAVVLLAVAPGARTAQTTRALIRDAGGFLLLAAGAFGTGAAVSLLAPAGVARALVAGAVGAGLYVVGARVAAPRQLQVLAGARRGSVTS